MSDQDNVLNNSKFRFYYTGAVAKTKLDVMQETMALFTQASLWIAQMEQLLENFKQALLKEKLAHAKPRRAPRRVDLDDEEEEENAKKLEVDEPEEEEDTKKRFLYEQLHILIQKLILQFNPLMTRLADIKWHTENSAHSENQEETSLLILKNKKIVEVELLEIEQQFREINTFCEKNHIMSPFDGIEFLKPNMDEKKRLSLMERMMERLKNPFIVNRFDKL